MDRRTISKTLIISAAYLILGNVTAILGTRYPERFFNSALIEVLFAPYTFIAGMSEFAGWDWLSLVLEGIAFLLTLPFSFSVVLIIEGIRSKITPR